jgi:hypothetical protein
MIIKSPTSQNWKKVFHDLPLSNFNTLSFSHMAEEKICSLFFVLETQNKLDLQKM